jgi:predicted RecB family nuclease
MLRRASSQPQGLNPRALVLLLLAAVALRAQAARSQTPVLGPRASSLQVVALQWVAKWTLALRVMVQQVMGYTSPATRVSRARCGWCYVT